MTSIHEQINTYVPELVSRLGRDDITYIPLNVTEDSKVINGVFERPQSEAQIGNLMGYETANYMLYINTDDVSNITKVGIDGTGDRFVIDGITYLVTKFYIEQDGIVSVELRKS